LKTIAILVGVCTCNFCQGYQSNLGTSHCCCATEGGSSWKGITTLVWTIPNVYPGLWRLFLPTSWSWVSGPIQQPGYLDFLDQAISLSKMGCTSGELALRRDRTKLNVEYGVKTTTTRTRS
jgi:hypothetical protein